MTEATPMGAESDPVDRIEALLNDEPQEEVTEPVEEAEAVEEIEEEETSEADEEDAIEEVELDAEALSAMLGLDPSQIAISEDGALKLKTKIDGEEGEATLAELVKSYQLESHVNRKSMELAERRKAIEAEAEQAQRALGEQLQQADYLLSGMEARLLSEYQNVDWNYLRINNPAEFAALQQEYAVRNQEIQNWKQQAVTASQKQAQQNQMVQQEQYSRYLSAERDALVNALPSWSDESTAKREKGEIISFLREQGIPDQEIQSLSNHKHLLIVRDAMLYRKASADAKTAEKKVKKVMKPVQKPGARKSKADINSEAMQKQRMKMRNSGSVDDVADYLLNVI